MAELRPYTPTWRDTVASWMMGQGQSSPERRAFVGGLLGSTGLGSTGVGVVDATPVGGLLSLQEASQAGDKTGMALASAGLIPGAGVAEKVAAKVAERSAPAAEKFITAYHGSPHSFDKFSLDKIGTGEGAQVYGHGLYFADNEGVAKSYRDTLAGKQSGVRIDGVPVEQIGVSPSAAQIAHMHLSGTADMDELLQRNIDALDKHKAALAANPNNRMAQMNADSAQRTIDAINEIKGKNIAFEPNKGSMYQVRINADPEHFLDWDKPLMEQPEAVRRLAGWTPQAEAEYKAARLSDTDRLLAALEGDGNYVSARLPTPKGALPADTLGANIYESSKLVPGNYRDSVAASQTLRDAGIPGIKYLDAGSRISGSPNTYTVQAMYKGKPYADAVKFQDKASADGYIAKLKEDGFDHSFSEKRNEKTNNYVVFDDSIIEILKKYGLVGLLGGGAAMGASQQQQQGVPSL